MRQKISIVTLGVSDLERSLKFYRDGLGWKLSSDSQENIAFFPMGGVVLALYPREKLAEDALIDPAGSGFSGITLSYNAKSQESVKYSKFCSIRSKEDPTAVILLLAVL